MNLSEVDIKRFWSKVQKTGHCWLWTASRNYNGYGNFSLDGKTFLAHRIAFFLSNGISLSELFVCHKCDNPACVNPEHLFLGTQRDNMQDSLKKGRKPSYPGSKNGRAKLTETEVNEIRRLHLEGYTSTPLIRKFGVCKSQINNIVAGSQWKQSSCNREHSELPKS